jgi:hypothetical protein
MSCAVSWHASLLGSEAARVPAIDPTSLIIAVSTLIATLYGVRQAKAGREDSRRQQIAANLLEEREQKAAEVDQALRHAREDAATAYERLQAERAEVKRLADEKEEIARSLRAELNKALMDRSTLQSIVADEVAREALRTARQIEAVEADPATD